MAKKTSGLIKRFNQAQFHRDMVVRDHYRVFVLDIVTITLGKLGMNPDDLEHFRDTYLETEADYCSEILQDFYDNHDKDLSYAKDRIDRAIKQYVSEDMFVPYDKRYGGMSE